MLTELAFVLLAGIKFGALYALTALGLVVVHEATKTVNFAHGAFVDGGTLELSMSPLPSTSAASVSPPSMSTSPLSDFACRP